MIEIKNLTKKYDQTTALKELTLTIPEGKIFGFLGHNGAGKSTTIKCLTSVIEPTSGEIYFDKLSLKEHRQEIKEKIAYIPDTPDLFLQLSAHEYWELLQVAYNKKDDVTINRLNEFVKLFDLEDHVDETIASFSHGMRQKTMLIGALMIDPDIWILDEPLQGLDPQAAFDLKEQMKAHAKKGKTVVFSTHVLETAQQLCDELAILKNGEILYEGSVENLLSAHENETLETIYLQMAGRQALEESQTGEVHE